MWRPSAALLALPIAVATASPAPVQSPKFEFKKVRVETVLDNGSTRKHVDVVIVGDGYVAEDLESGGVYERDVKRIVKEFFELAPFSTYKDFFNVHAVYAESFNRGAENRPGEDQLQTILDTSFDAPGGRLLFFQRSENVMRLAKKAPQADIVIVVVNDPRYGGSGGVIWGRTPAPVCSNAKASIQIAIHELGHSFAGLGDEYLDPQAANTYPIPEGTRDIDHPNLTLARFVDTTTRETIAKTVKWKHFLELPGAEGLISAFEGGYYRPVGVFRPQKRCMMREDAPFCYVCQEELARSIHKVTGRKFNHTKYHEKNPIRRRPQSG